MFIDPLWRKIRHEEMHLKEYANRKEAIDQLQTYFCFNNQNHKHQASYRHFSLWGMLFQHDDVTRGIISIEDHLPLCPSIRVRSEHKLMTADIKTVYQSLSVKEAKWELEALDRRFDEESPPLVPVTQAPAESDRLARSFG